GRMRACNVLTVPEFDRRLIADAITCALHDQDFRTRLTTCVNPYGDGNSSERICKVLEDVDLGKLLSKQMTY
ncbi:MAG TPA: hypothetical protein PKV55_16480, partial [Nitrospira sp.]|nr:hypothetical protein [Nitrospira sp.]